MSKKNIIQIIEVLSLFFISFIIITSCDKDNNEKNHQLKINLTTHYWVPKNPNYQFLILKFTTEGKSFDLLNSSVINQYELIDSTIIVSTTNKKINIFIHELTDSSLTLKFDGQQNLIELRPAKPYELIYGKWRVISTSNSFIMEFLPDGSGSIEMISDTTNQIENLRYQIKSDLLILIDKNDKKKELRYVLQNDNNLELIDSDSTILQLQRI